MDYFEYNDYVMNNRANEKRRPGALIVLGSSGLLAFPLVSDNPWNAGQQRVPRLLGDRAARGGYLNQERPPKAY